MALEIIIAIDHWDRHNESRSGNAFAVYVVFIAVLTCAPILFYSDSVSVIF